MRARKYPAASKSSIVSVSLTFCSSSSRISTCQNGRAEVCLSRALLSSPQPAPQYKRPESVHLPPEAGHLRPLQLSSPISSRSQIQTPSRQKRKGVLLPFKAIWCGGQAVALSTNFERPRNTPRNKKKSSIAKFPQGRRWRSKFRDRRRLRRVAARVDSVISDMMLMSRVNHRIARSSLWVWVGAVDRASEGESSASWFSQERSPSSTRKWLELFSSLMIMKKKKKSQFAKDLRGGGGTAMRGTLDPNLCEKKPLLLDQIMTKWWELIGWLESFSSARWPSFIVSRARSGLKGWTALLAVRLTNTNWAMSLFFFCTFYYFFW